MHLSDGLKIWTDNINKTETVSGGHIKYLVDLFNKGLALKPTIINTASSKPKIDVPEYKSLLKFNLGEYEDGTKNRIKYPAQVWRKNDDEVRQVITSTKKIINIRLAPDLETADIDTSNNSWPKKQEDSEFDAFKSKIKG